MCEQSFCHIVQCDSSSSSKKNLRIANSELGCYYLEEIISCQQRYWTAVRVPTPRRAVFACFPSEILSTYYVREMALTFYSIPNKKGASAAI